MLIDLLATAYLSGMFFYQLVNYIRELKVYFTRREDYARLKKPSMQEGDMGGDEVVSPRGRLVIAYPIGLLASGVLSLGFATKVISQMSGVPSD